MGLTEYDLNWCVPRGIRVLAIEYITSSLDYSIWLYIIHKH